ncbi:MAG: GGDEF domain-containing protein, partial [Candidatus Acidiferrales bacterium]
MVEDSFAEHEQSMQQRQRDWQLRLLVALIVGVVGVGLALYTTLALWRADGLDLSRALAGPLLYGLIAAVVLADLYLAQKEAVIQGLEQEAVKQKIEAELNRELALLDPVTEVYNRRYLRVLLKKELSRVQRYQTPLSMMMVDITGFR